MLEPPRRLDVEDDEFAALRGDLSIFVNGERMSRVLAYDIDRGFVSRIASNANGGILVEGNDVVTEVVCGHVQVGLRGASARA
jgi:hypothetical protein